MEEPVLNRKGLMTTVVSVGVFSFILAGCGAGAGTGTTTADIQNETTLEASASVQSATASEASASAASKADFDSSKAFEVRKKDTNVAAVFMGNDLQPLKKADGETLKTDTVWIYYDDMTFDQFANVNGKMEGFSAGTYEFVNGDDFNYEGEDDNNGEIIIRRYLKYQDGKGVTDYSSEHTYVLETLGYHKAHAVKDNESKKAVSIFAAPGKQKYNDKNGEEKMLDTTWIFYDDMTFEQFVMKDDNVETFSKGTYAFENGGDFIYEDGEKNNGKITIICNKRYEDGKELTGHSSTNTYELNTLELDQLYVSEK